MRSWFSSRVIGEVATPLAGKAESLSFLSVEHDSQWEHLACLIMSRNGCDVHVQRNTLHHLALCMSCTLRKSAVRYERHDEARCKTRVVNVWCVGRLLLACRLVSTQHPSQPQVLHWGGEWMLMRRWCNGSEVTGDLMRGTRHWSVFCTQHRSASTQMTAKWRNEREEQKQAATEKIKIIVRQNLL